MKILSKKAAAINGVEYTIGDYFNKDDFVNNGKDVFVRHDPLLRVAKTVLGIKGKSVSIVQPANKSNEWSTTAIVRYKFNDDIIFESAAEARISNVESHMSKYTATLAETRASSRALRFALGLDVCSAEEIAKNVDQQDLSEDQPAEDMQIRIIKRHIEKGTVTEAKALELSQVDSLKDLTQKQAADLINKLTKLQNRKKAK